MTCKNLLAVALLLVLGVMSSRAQITCPPNLDFELGTFANWHFYRGSPGGAEADGGGCCPISTPTYCGFGSACVTPSVRHQIMTGAGVDPCCSFPVVPPGAGTYTLKLGNSSVNAQAEKMRYYINVPTGTTSYSLFYRYAIVLQDEGHDSTEQPRFEVRAYDSATNAPLPCAQFSYVTTGGLPGFYSVTSAPCGSTLTPIRCKAWTTQSLDLSSMGGTTVAVDFATGDCLLGGHYGYAYLDLNCGLFAITSVACGTSTITLSAPGGFAYYSWFDSSTFALPALGTLQTVVLPTPLDTTTYACVIAPYPGFGCPDTVYTRVIPSNLQIHPSNDTTICQGATARLTDSATDVMGPITHAWSPATGLSSTTGGVVWASPTVTTTYTVTATNPVGCTKTDTIRVAVYQMNLVTGSDSATCFNVADGTDSVKATGAGPFTYVWSTTPVQTTSKATGLLGNTTYSVTVTSAAGCVSTTSQFVGQPLPRTIAVATIYDDTTCSPYSPIPGLSANGRITLKGLTPKSIMAGYTYTVQYDFAGATLTQVCTAYTTGDSLTIMNLPKGVYSNITIVGVAAPGYMCDYNTVGPVTINDPQAPVNAYINNPVVCEGSPINFNTTNITGVPTGAPILYSWAGPMGYTSMAQNPTILAAALGSAGVYTFAISTHGGTCHDTAYSTVTVNPKPIPMGATSNSPICEGSTLNLWDSSSNGADGYSWAGPNGFSSIQQKPKINNATVAASGTYTVTISRLGCTATDMVTVIVNPQPPAPIVSDTVYCLGDAAAPLTAVGTNLLWYTSPTGGTGSATAPTPSTASPGTTIWYVTQTSVDGCESKRAKIKVKVFNKIVPAITVSDSVVCLGNRILFTAVDADKEKDDYEGIRWTFEGGESIENVNPVYHSFNGPGDYTFTVTTKYKVCADQTASKSIKVIAQPFINLGPDKALCPGSEALTLTDAVNSSTPGAKWTWSTGDAGSSAVITTAGTYYAKVTIQGCSAYDTVTIARDCYLDIPNAFSPNGDGSNDYFFPRNKMSKGLTSFTMNIYNRWGELIFQTESLDGRGWNGSYNGAMQPSGVYVYMIDAEFKDGRKEHQQGNVTLIK